MQTFIGYRSFFRSLYHGAQGVRMNPRISHLCHAGHDINHDITVAAHVIVIAPNPRTAEMAFCAALLHSLDYSIGSSDLGMITRELLRAHLPPNHFTQGEIADIVDAALRHKEMNRPDQSLVQQVLMDADRLAGLTLTTFMSLAKCAPTLPAFEFNHLAEINPKTTYKDPRSTLDNVRTHFDYLPMLRLPKAKELGVIYAEHLKRHIADIHDQYKFIGLVGLVS